MADIVADLRDRARHCPVHDAPDTAVALDRLAGEIAVLRSRIAELEEHDSWQAERHVERTRREDELRHLLADLLDLIHPGWDGPTLPTFNPTRAAAKHARRRPRTVEDGFGSTWEMCDRSGCELHVVRPGTARCYRCEEEEAPDGPR